METTVILKVNKERSFRLENRGGAGYSWVVEANNEKVTRVTTAMADSGEVPGKKPVGGSSIVVLTIRGLTKGTSRIQLVQKRIWEEGVPPLNTYIYNVTVTE
ncbi:hypothetical protein A8C56_19365 [Niabella ginsenosidivorans]|uniref:Proteinase inhibitor I42 chagasin domain-containing protein n=1 Tax=Niabella ginsenosidivorans TaxID=1176587 RepID=A0A1A9I5E4_9BACT|nr:protease inhibitor I42 family protein [Niabella ginsenosidivorans]ANH82856.1 hypothetical protein A8C56_19365 [Niabella ginsenosidivorans]